jgi:ubiquinone biosynthesis protein COQ9
MIPILRRLIQFLKVRNDKNVITNSKNELEATINAIRTDIEMLAKKECNEKLDVCWYGAYYIDPKHLVFRVCIQTDAVKKRLEANKTLIEELRLLLETHNYPLAARSNVFIGFESQETVDRESKGSWYHHFK